MFLINTRREAPQTILKPKVPGINPVRAPVTTHPCHSHLAPADGSACNIHTWHWADTAREAWELKRRVTEDGD